jgi:hypothetical protein
VHKFDNGAEPRSRIIATSAVKGLNMHYYTSPLLMIRIYEVNKMCFEIGTRLFLFSANFSKLCVVSTDFLSLRSSVKYAAGTVKLM